MSGPWLGVRSCEGSTWFRLRSTRASMFSSWFWNQIRKNQQISMCIEMTRDLQEIQNISWPQGEDWDEHGDHDVHDDPIIPKLQVISYCLLISHDQNHQHSTHNEFPRSYHGARFRATLHFQLIQWKLWHFKKRNRNDETRCRSFAVGSRMKWKRRE